MFEHPATLMVLLVLACLTLLVCTVLAAAVVVTRRAHRQATDRRVPGAVSLG